MDMNDTHIKDSDSGSERSYGPEEPDDLTAVYQLAASIISATIASAQSAKFSGRTSAPVSAHDAGTKIADHLTKTCRKERCQWESRFGIEKDSKPSNMPAEWWDSLDDRVRGSLPAFRNKTDSPYTEAELDEGIEACRDRLQELSQLPPESLPSDQSQDDPAGIEWGDDQTKAGQTGDGHEPFPHTSVGGDQSTQGGLGSAKDA